MRTVLYFGNENLLSDSLAIKLGRELEVEGFEFIYCENLNQVLEYDKSELIILDVAKGIDKVVRFK